MGSHGTRRVKRLTRPRGLMHLAQLGLFLAVEAGWLFGWSVALGIWIDPGGSDPLLGLSGIAGLLIAGLVATRLALGRLRSLRLAQLALALLGLGLATLPIAGSLLGALLEAGSGDAWSRIGGQETGAWALTLLVWWRGVAARRARLTLDSVEAGFRWAIIALIGLFLLAASAGSSRLLDALIGSALLTLFAGLVGLPLARILDLNQGQRHQADSRLAIGRHWLAMLLGIVGALLLVTLALASTLTFERIDAFLQPLAEPLSTLLWGILYVIALPIGLLIEGLVYLFRPRSPAPRAGTPVSSIGRCFGWVCGWAAAERRTKHLLNTSAESRKSSSSSAARTKSGC